jgi:hypothetical protein
MSSEDKDNIEKESIVFGKSYKGRIERERAKNVGEIEIRKRRGGEEEEGEGGEEEEEDILGVKMLRINEHKHSTYLDVRVASYNPREEQRRKKKRGRERERKKRRGRKKGERGRHVCAILGNRLRVLFRGEGE